MLRKVSLETNTEQHTFSVDRNMNFSELKTLKECEQKNLFLKKNFKKFFKIFQEIV